MPISIYSTKQNISIPVLVEYVLHSFGRSLEEGTLEIIVSGAVDLKEQDTLTILAEGEVKGLKNKAAMWLYTSPQNLTYDIMLHPSWPRFAPKIGMEYPGKVRVKSNCTPENSVFPITRPLFENLQVFEANGEPVYSTFGVSLPRTGKQFFSFGYYTNHGVESQESGDSVSFSSGCEVSKNIERKLFYLREKGLSESDYLKLWEGLVKVNRLKPLLYSRLLDEPHEGHILIFDSENYHIRPCPDLPLNATSKSQITNSQITNILLTDNGYYRRIFDAYFIAVGEVHSGRAQFHVMHNNPIPTRFYSNTAALPFTQRKS